VTPRSLAPAVAPLLAGLAAAAVVSLFDQNPRLFVRAPLSDVFLAAGVAATALVVGVRLARARAAAARERALAETRAAAAAERRRLLLRLDHELKNPLTAIRAGLANLAEAPSEQSRRSALESVEVQAVRLGSLLADLRKLAELETQPLERGRVDLDELLREVADTLDELPDAASRTLTLTLPNAPWPLPVVEGDRDLLFLAMHNLATNAVKFSRPGDTIEIRAFEEGDGVVIEVADTGIGIPTEEIAQVWGELERGRSARGIPGTGIGLALVQTIIVRHRGVVSLRSRTAEGTVVRLELPLV
jgi:two-component system OmpR family sensor kinase